MGLDTSGPEFSRMIRKELRKPKYWKCRIVKEWKILISRIWK